jgi:signal transduction histidine kinase
MKVSAGTAVICFLASLFMGAGVSLLIHFNSPDKDHRLQLAIGIFLVLVFILIIGIFSHYQRSLKAAIQNLDEAQQLAALGSWERDIVTGRGYWSDNRYRLFGMEPRKNAPSQAEFFAMIHPEDREHVRESVEAAARSGSSYDITFRQANDIHDRIFLSRGRVMLGGSGTPQKIVGTTQDITEKCRQEDFLRDLVKQKNFFINRLGHDLKTPLTPLVALLPMIREKIADEKLRHQLEICISNTAIIRDLVTKTMDLARRSAVHRARLNLEDLLLADVVDSIVESMQSMIKAHGLQLTNSVERDMFVHADRKELEELFCNLISNAIKFSPADSPARIAAEQWQDRIAVRVQDSGIGLTQEEKNLIFDEFYKADASRHELGSSGLGLAICRQIIENHGGRIWAESDGKGHGTSICFTLAVGGNT